MALPTYEKCPLPMPKRELTGDIFYKRGLDKLTNTERKIYEGYVAGMGPQEMSVQFSVKVSTIYSHTKNILRKTGLDSYRKVQQYAAILRQTQEEQENKT